ncbi:MAG: cell division protein ZapA [Ruminococcus sp.]|nr:cell division protein ZapA [Ruminococcus sp.]
MENKKIRVSIFVAGQRFNILTDKSEKYVLDIASEIDARINSLVISQEMSRERAAVLTALDYADDGKQDKEDIAAVKEQMKDYLREIERMQDNNAKLVGDYNLLKAEYERLIEERQSGEDAVKAAEECRSQNAALQGQFDDLKEKLRQSEEQVGELREQLNDAQRRAEELKQPVGDPEEDVPLPEEPPVQEEETITAEDDLFFEPENEEEPIKPQKKKKKNRHEHNHENPYQQKAKQKEQGYQQQRQYSFFDINEDE